MPVTRHWHIHPGLRLPEQRMATVTVQHLGNKLAESVKQGWSVKRHDQFTSYTSESCGNLRLLLQCLFGVLTFGDIRHGTNQVQHLPSFIPHYRAPIANHRIIPVGPTKTIFLRPDLPFSSPQPLYNREHPLAIIWMNTVGPPGQIKTHVVNEIT